MFSLLLTLKYQTTHAFISGFYEGFQRELVLPYLLVYRVNKLTAQYVAVGQSQRYPVYYNHFAI